MLKYIGKRLLNLIPILLILTFLVYVLVYLTPGDPALKKLTSQGTIITEEILEKERESMGLNRPFMVRYIDWLINVVQGDFGNSYVDNTPILPKIMLGLGYTLTLASASLVVAIVIAIPIGILTAVRKDGLFDNITKVLTFTGNALPHFLLSLALMYFFCIKMRLFPVIAQGSVQGLFLPTMALAIPMASKFTRQTRADVLCQLNEEYVIGMHARGVKQRLIMYNNVLHNALGAIITIISLQVRTLIGGSIVIETIFRWPGVGSLIMGSINTQDFPAIQGTVLILATLQVLVNLVTDISYCMIDHRIELE